MRNSRVTAIGIFIAVVVILGLSTFSAISGSVEILQYFFALIFITGLVILLASSAWYYMFRGSVNVINQVESNPPLEKCLDCNHVGLDANSESLSSRFGMPRARYTMTCPECSTKVRADFPFTTWNVINANPERNADFAWLYDGANLTRAELQIVASGQHTLKAQQKIRERMLVRRQQILADIADGNLESIHTLEDQMIFAGKGVNIKLGNAEMSELQYHLKPNESIVLWAMPIVYAEQRTKDKVPYLAPEDSGQFFITSQHYGFVGQSKNLEKKLTDIVEILTRNEQTVAIFRKGRKTPEAFINIDADLVKSVIDGLQKQL